MYRCCNKVGLKIKKKDKINIMYYYKKRLILKFINSVIERTKSN